MTKYTRKNKKRTKKEVVVKIIKEEGDKITYLKTIITTNYEYKFVGDINTLKFQKVATTSEKEFVKTVNINQRKGNPKVFNAILNARERDKKKRMKAEKTAEAKRLRKEKAKRLREEKAKRLDELISFMEEEERRLREEEERLRNEISNQDDVLPVDCSWVSDYKLYI